MIKKTFFALSILIGPMAHAEECKTVELKQSQYQCPSVTQACLSGTTTKGQIDLINENGHTYMSFGLPQCAVTHLDQTYCEFSSSNGKELALYPEDPDSWNFTGSLYLRAFPIKPGVVYGCEYQIIE